MKKLIFVVIFLLFGFIVNVWAIGPYTDNGNGTVTDQGTGLVWEKSDHGIEKMWKDALLYCENLTFAGYNDWRLPNIQELRSIVKYDTYDPAIDSTVFDYPKISDLYWSSTPRFYSGGELIWTVDFGYSYTNYRHWYMYYHVRCVRGKSSNLSDTGQTKCYDNSAEIQCPSEGEDFYGQDANYQETQQNFQTSEVNGDKIVKDLNTKLMWQRSDDGVDRTWQDAVDYCKNLTFAGYSDWKLPTNFELSTIINYGHHEPVINETIFDCRNGKYWTSTINADDSASAWYINFRDGYDMYYTKNYSYYVRCMRSGLSGGSSTSSCSSAANPSSALNAVEYKSGVTQPNPTDNIITVGTSSSIYLQPSLNVASGDVGQSAVLVLYVYLKDFYTGIMMPTKSVTLSSVQKFTNLPNALNFSDASGMDFYVYYGYRIGSTIKYDAYEVNVTSSCSSN